MPIKIISKRDGFRRCGIAHPAEPVVYPDGTFSQDQIKRLKAEPMLIVEEIKASKSKGDRTEADGGAQTGAKNPGGDK